MLSWNWSEMGLRSGRVREIDREKGRRSGDRL